jgi:hypothetical protein
VLVWLEEEERSVVGPVGQKAEQASWLARPARLKLKRISFKNKNWIIEYTKSL